MKRFIKNNILIFWLGVLSAIISISYAITYNMPDYFGIEGWYSLLNNLAIGYLAALIFYIIQVYIPQYKQNQQVYACIQARIENIVRHMKEIFDELGKRYIENYSEKGITDELLFDLLKRINSNDRVQVLNTARLSSTTVTDGDYFTVKEWIISRLNFVEHEIDSLFKYYPSYMTPQLMKTLEEIMQSTMHQNLGRSLLQMPAGISFADCKQDIFLKPYYGLMKDLDDLKATYII